MKTAHLFKLLLSIIALMSINSMFAQQRLRVAILGDSYSTYEGEVEPAENEVWYFKKPDTNKTDVNQVEQTWWAKFIESGNYELAINNSYSGSTICNTGYNGEDSSYKSFIARMSNLNNPDIILIFGATNDSWANAPIGQYVYDNWSREELYSFRPAMAYMLSYLKEEYPNAKPYFIINDLLKPEIVDSIITICDHYKTPYIALQEIDKIDGHPSIKGMHQIVEQLTTYFCNCD